MKTNSYTYFQTMWLLLTITAPAILAYGSGESIIGAYPEMLDVPGETFQMGKLPDEKGGSDESPSHEITLTPYRIAKYEVTNAQYTAALNWALQKGYLHNNRFQPYADFPGGSVYMRGNFLKNINPGTDIQFINGEFIVKQRNGLFLGNHPVVEVTWYGAAAYTNWISELQGLTPCYDVVSFALIAPHSGGYRLPLEAEWEYAAGWSPNTPNQHWRFANSKNTISSKEANYNFNNPLKNIGLTDYPYTTPAGYFNGQNPDTIDSSSPVGCYDMSGNAYEWCQDHFYPYPGPESSRNSSEILKEFRIVRGGSWSSISDSLRTTNRGWSNPGMTFRTYGIRVAQTSQPK